MLPVGVKLVVVEFGELLCEEISLDWTQGGDRFLALKGEASKRIYAVGFLEFKQSGSTHLRHLGSLHMYVSKWPEFVN